MAIRAIEEWDTVAADNDFAPADGGFPEFMPRSGVNDAMRVHLGEMRKHYNDPDWIKVRFQGPDAADEGSFLRSSGTVFTITFTPDQDISSYFTDGRIIQIIDGGGTGVDLVTQCSGNATYGAGVTTVTIKGTDTIHADATDAQVFHSSIIRFLGTQDAETDFYIPSTTDDEGIQAANDAAEAAGGGTVLFVSSNYTINSTITVDAGVRVRWLGALPEVVITQADAADLDEMVLVNNANTMPFFENIRFFVNWSEQTGGNGYGVNIANATTPTFADCQFLECKTGIKFTDSNAARIGIHGCKFFTYVDFGIASNAPTDTHQGVIDGCVFNGTGVAGVDPAAIKVAGTWTITGNYLEIIGHASLLPRGIWLWNASLVSNGGVNSTVTGNTILAGNAANGRCIEVGGRRNTITGNACGAGTSGVGIYAISTAGGVTIAGNIISGNTCNGGIGIAANDLTGGTVIHGNNLAPSTIGIQCDAASGAHIAGNHVRGGTDGITLQTNANNVMLDGNFVINQTQNCIELEGTAVDCSITNNRLLGAATNGIVVASGATGTRCRYNEIESTITNKFVHNNAVRYARHNSPIPAMIGDGTVYNEGVDTPEIDSANFTQEDFPHMKTKGGKVRISIRMKQAAADSIFYRIYFGTTGDKGDTLMHTFSTAFGTADEYESKVLTIGAGHTKWGLGLLSSVGVETANYELDMVEVEE